MENELNCNQVLALMSFYVENKLNDKLKSYIDDHLKKCQRCRQVYMSCDKVAYHVSTLVQEDEISPYKKKQYANFKDNLSAYFDNELNELESIKIKKIAISNPIARKDLENMYTFKKLLHNSFDKTKNDLKTDYSGLIIKKLYRKSNENNFFGLNFSQVVYAFFAMITLISLGCLMIFR